MSSSFALKLQWPYRATGSGTNTVTLRGDYSRSRPSLISLWPHLPKLAEGADANVPVR